MAPSKLIFFLYITKPTPEPKESPSIPLTQTKSPILTFLHNTLIVTIRWD